MTNDIGVINTWLAILAIATLVQAIAMLGFAVALLRFMRRAEAALLAASRALEPLAADLSASLADIRSVSAAALEADRTVRAVSAEIGRGVQQARGVVMGRLWPVVGAVQAVRAVAGAITARRRASRGRERDDELAESRFVAEGGPDTMKGRVGA